MPTRNEVAAPRPRRSKATPMRERVLAAAFATFRDRGFSEASTLEIATRAKVSKRELYSLFEDKHAILIACIRERTERMRLPLELPPPQNRAELVGTLTAFGTAVLCVVSDPNVLAVHRLAIAESVRSPALARTLESAGRQANRAALIRLLKAAQSHQLLRAGDAAVLAEIYFAALWGDLLVRLLLRVTSAPTPKEAEQQARAATDLLLKLYSAATR
jgi:AcrR family transcriptional regulator